MDERSIPPPPGAGAEDARSSPSPPEGAEGRAGAERAVRRDLRELYRRTWELELLISGAVVFALLQLPGAVDGWFLAVQHQVASGMATLAFLAYYVSKLILYTLIGAFLAHLAARALWVGLIGLDSVFPQGIRWERSEAGPIQKRLKLERTPSLGEAIERSDAVASVIFSAAFAIVLTLMLVAVLSAVFGGVAIAAGIWLGEDAVTPLFWTLYFLFFIPAAIAQLLDKVLAGKIAPEGRLARFLERVMRGFYTTTGPVGRVLDAITGTLSTNLPRWRATVGLSVAFALLLAVFVVRDVLLGGGVLRLDGYAHFPDFYGPEVVLPAFYGDAGEETPLFSEVPSIQSQIVTGPYVRLFLPIAAERLGPTVEAWCPAVGPIHASGLRFSRRPRRAALDASNEAAAAVLDCLEGLQRVELDGAGVRADLLFHLDPRTGRRGVLALLPTRALAPGRHTLTVHRLPRAEDAPRARPQASAAVAGEGEEEDEREDPDARAPWVIPFWI